LECKILGSNPRPGRDSNNFFQKNNHHEGDLDPSIALMAESNHSNEMIIALRKGDDRALTQIYKELKPEFLSWSAREYNLQNEDAVELYQLSMVIFYDNVMSGKLDQFSSQVKTYIFGIAKNKARELLRKKRRQMPLSDLLGDYVEEDDDIDEKLLVESRLDQVRMALNNLGKKCQDMIRLFYYKKMDLESIAQLMNYSSARTAKNMKYKCLQQLRKVVNQN